MAQPYSQVPETISLNDHFPSRHRERSLSVSSDESDIIYKDNLDIEPFEEKDNRFRDEPRLEEGGVDEEGYPVEPRRLRPRKKSRKVLAVLITIIGFAASIGLLSAWAYSAPAYSISKGNRHMTIEHIFNGTFAAYTQRIDWVKEAEDGTFSHVDSSGNIILNTIDTIENGTVLVNASDVLAPNGDRLHFQTWKLSADMRYVLLKTDHVKQWRHSSFGNYWIHRLSDSSTFPISPPSYPPTTKIVTWSPVGHSLAYVDRNDLYVILGDELLSDNPKSLRITNDGSDVVFNGAPDWVYEEEVFQIDSAFWWSPDGETIAYLRSDEEAVPDFKLQYFNPSRDAFQVNQFQTELDMKYPKPGNPNPLVTVHTFSLSTYQSTSSVISSTQALSWPDRLTVEQSIIMEVGWAGANALIVKEIDRAARNGTVMLFQDGLAHGSVVRTLGKSGEEGDDGWIDHGQDIIPVTGRIEGYLDLIPKDGFMHIALFSPYNATEPIWITSGDWEVTSISGINQEKGIVYYMAAHPSIDRYLYAEYLPTASSLADFLPNPTALTDTSASAYYAVSFSPGAKYYVLSYKGPQVPWQRLKEITDGDEQGADVLLEDNAKLNQTLSEFMSPIITRSTFISEGIEMNMVEILPPGIDTSGRKKYPVLFRVYGGPGSQTVSNQYERDWQSYLACEKKYITIIVDGRGTGFKGRPFRNPVMDNLGYWEVVDQIAAAREVAKRRYVDRRRIGIWGWSYGGFMTCKTLEANSGVFSLGMAVAPVTNWLYYDSIYTERYMSTPSANPGGYFSSAVNNVTAFSNVDFALAHGSGDDNVHYMNSASLLDKFTQERIRGWRFRMFTDSDHNINLRGSHLEVYQWMSDFLDEKWGRGGTVRG